METRELIMNVGASNDLFGAYAENAVGIYGESETIDGLKEDVLEAIRQIKSDTPIDEQPDILKGDYRIVWKFEPSALLRAYGYIITNAGLEKLTGINQKQIWLYANDKAKPREATRRKLENAFHQLGTELANIRL